MRILGAALLCLVVVCAAAFSARAQNAATLPPDAEYVSIQNGHLFLNGARVRFWGAIGGFPGKTHADNVAVVKRLKAMGFNLVRYWPSVNDNTSYTPGDGSRADLIDHFLGCLRAENMRVWCAGLNNVGRALPIDVDVVDEAQTASAWATAVGEKGLELRNNPARIWDKRLETLALNRMKSAARHVNRHNNLAWADDPVFAVWELSNEEWWFGRMLSGGASRLPAFFQRSLLDQWNAFLAKKYGGEDQLKAAWLGLLPGESLEKRSVLLLPLRANVEPGPQQRALGVAEGIATGVVQKYSPGVFNAARGRDVIEFLLQIWVTHKQREAAAVKTLGKSLRLAPLVWDTGIGYEIQAQWLQQHADAIAHDTYITGFTVDPTHKRYPWYSGLEELPRMCWDKPWIEHNRQPDKPYLVYETQIEQPAKYRAEYPLRIASLGAIQDWDVVCWHYFGGVPDSSVSDKPYGRAMDYTVAGGHPQGYHYQFDETQMAAMRTAAEVFKNGLLAPAPTPTTFIFGRNSLLDPASMEYGTSYGKTGERMMPTTYRHGVRLRIDDTREGDEIIGPSLKPRVYEPNPITPTREITYDWQRGFLRFDAPGVAQFTGFLAQYGAPVVRFEASGVLLKNVQIINPPAMPFPVTLDEKYVSFCLAATDGLPLAKTKRAVLSLVSTSFNSGFQLDLSKLTQEFGWFLNKGATLSTGGLPVLVARVGALIEAPTLSGMRYRLLDWHLREIGSGVIKNGALPIPADKPVFVVELTR